MLKFASNGLLDLPKAPKSPIHEAGDEDDAPEEEPRPAISFVANGLLAMPSQADAATATVTQTQTQIRPATPPLVDNLGARELMPTLTLDPRDSSVPATDVDMLSGGQSPQPIPQSLFLPDTQSSTQYDDYDLPRPSQLFRDAQQQRAAFKETHEPSSSSLDASSLDSTLALPPPPIPSYDSRLVRCRTYDGRTIFFARRKKAQSSREIVNGAGAGGREVDESLGNVLEVPLHRMMEELAMKAVDTTSGAGPSSPSKPHKSTNGPELWVDRYRPTRFLDLAGDERVNREALAWVKEWDQCVFGLKKKKSVKRKRDRDDFFGGAGTSTGNGAEGEKVYEDQWGRPKEKILLISGPPGLGKTTLAHVVAKQAGYDVLEVNASDSRNASVIEDRIRPTLESGHAVMDKSKKPVLVVIDEIDGAMGEGSGNHAGFVNKLIGLTFDPPKKKNPNGTKHARRPLQRPIICICNDLYAPALAKLRLHARIIRLYPSPPLVLTKYLKTICAQEGLKTEGRALSLLAEVCQGDLRSCVNALQIMNMRGPVVTEDRVRTSTVGVKESETSAQSVWKDLFKPLSKKAAQSMGLTPDQEARWMSRLVRGIEGAGGVDKIAIGAFEHYITLHPHETTFARFEASNAWLGMYDVLYSAAWNEQAHALDVYLPYMITPLFHHLAANGNPKMERGNEYWDSITKAKTSDEVLANLSKSLLYPHGPSQAQPLHPDIAGYRHLLGHTVLRTEFAGILMRLISPPMRPVNRQIIKAEEKEVLDRVVQIMVNTGLRYEQDKAEDGGLFYRLEPAIDSFIVFDGKRASDIGAARYAVRHLISYEVEEALAARNNQIVEKGIVGGGARLFGTGAKGRKDEGVVIDIADKPPVDFFGRPITLPEPQSDDTADSTGRDPKKARLDVPKKPVVPFVVNYKFHEGNSSAVRKPTKMSTFF